MSVAERPITETSRRSPSTQLALYSLLGGVLILIGLWVILAGLPLLWDLLFPIAETGVQASGLVINEFLRGALLLIATVGAVVGLGYLGLQAEKSHNTKGLREGAIVGAFFLYIVARITLGAGNVLYRQDLGAIGAVITFGLGLGLVFLLYKWFSMPGFATWLAGLSDSGWFEANVFKGNQGVRIRRLTVVAILVLGFWGIFVLISQRLLGFDRPNSPNDWYLNIPFTGTSEAPDTLPVMFKMHVVLPILLTAALIWFAWRLVNLPTFADFLIATEAEMNKVSWTSRRRLVQDTIVVMTTLIFMTVFLFVVDILWINILSSEYVWVLQVDTREARQKLEEKAQW